MDFEEVMQALEDANFLNLEINYIGEGVEPDLNRPVVDWLSEIEIYSSRAGNGIFAIVWDSDTRSFAVACAGQILEDLFTVIPCYPDTSYGALLTNEARLLVDFLDNTIPQAEEFTEAVKPFL